MTATLLFIRHGRTAANAAGLLLGRGLDPPLDETGRRQAEAVAAAVASRGVGRVVCSPLLRARQTAAALGPFELDDRWAEVDYGAWDGRPVVEVAPETWARWRADPTFAPPGGESLAEVGTRVRAACAELATSDETVAVVSHVSPIKAAVAWALGAGDAVAWRTHLDVASITTVVCRDHGPVLSGFNEVARP